MTRAVERSAQGARGSTVSRRSGRATVLSDIERTFVVKLLFAWVRAGLPVEAFIQTATVAAPFIEGPAGRAGVGIRTDIADFSQVLTVWNSNPKYLQKGKPCALSLTGPLSMKSLAYDTNPNFKLAEVMEYLNECDCLRRVGKLYAPRANSPLMRGSRSNIVSTRGTKGQGATQGRILYALASNLDHNFAPKDQWESWYDFAAECANFPVSQLESFSRFLYQQSDAFLGVINEYMNQRESSRDQNEPTCRVVVELFESRSPNREISTELKAALQSIHAHFPARRHEGAQTRAGTKVKRKVRRG